MGTFRRRVLSFGSAAGWALAAGTASATTARATGGPRREPQDDWLDQGGRRHRMVFDTLSTRGLGLGMNFVRNFFTANRTGYGIDADELSAVIILRSISTAFGFNDAIWAKHGDYLGKHVTITDPRSKAAPRTNLFLAQVDAPGLANGEVTLGDLAKLGVRFAVCTVAASSLAKAIAELSHGDPAAVLKELEANLVPNARMVPAGITALNRAQEHGYAFSYCG